MVTRKRTGTRWCAVSAGGPSCIFVERTAWRGTCISLATQPVDQLMQRLQALDEAGAALLDLQGCNNAIHTCLKRLFKNAISLHEASIQGLSHLFGTRGLEFLQCNHLYIFRLSFALAAHVWMSLASVYAAFLTFCLGWSRLRQRTPLVPACRSAVCFAPVLRGPRLLPEGSESQWYGRPASRSQHHSHCIEYVGTPRTSR